MTRETKMQEELLCVAAYDSGGTNTRVAIAGLDGEIIGSPVEEYTKEVSGNKLPGKIGDCIDDAIRKANKSLEEKESGKTIRIVAIGSSQAGIIDYDKGEIVSSVNVKDGKNIQMKYELEKRFGVPFYLENDANAAAYGVLVRDPQAEGMKNLVYIVMGTGIGGGIIINSKIYRGDGTAGEFGHTTLDPDGRKCGCGKNGCWEAYSSGWGIAESAKEFFAEKHIRKLLNLDGRTEIKAEHVFKAYREGSKDSKAYQRSKIIIDTVGKYNAIAVSNIINTLSPDAVFIGETVAKNNPEILEMLIEQVPGLLLPSPKKTEILQTELDNPGLYGAIQLAIEGNDKTQERS